MVQMKLGADNSSLHGCFQTFSSGNVVTKVMKGDLQYLCQLMLIIVKQRFAWPNRFFFLFNSFLFPLRPVLLETKPEIKV